MQLEKNRRGRELRVVLSGELDHHNAAIIREEVDRELDGSVKLLTLDMSGITFMDSSGIALILRIYRRLKVMGGRAWVEHAEKQPLKVIEASGIERMLNVSLTKEA